jgi:hypothetical protein
VNLKECLVQPVSITLYLNGVVELLLVKSGAAFVSSSVDSNNLLIVTRSSLSSFLADGAENDVELILVEVHTSHACDVNEISTENVREVFRVELSPGFLDS